MLCWSQIAPGASAALRAGWEQPELLSCPSGKDVPMARCLWQHEHVCAGCSPGGAGVHSLPSLQGPRASARWDGKSTLQTREVAALASGPLTPQDGGAGLCLQRALFN